MRAFLLTALLVCLRAAAQFPLPLWEQFDSNRVVLGQLPAREPPPDTLWAFGQKPVPVLELDTVIVDQCCLDPDPPILLARLGTWPRTRTGDVLPLFLEKLDADTAAWFDMGEWRAMPDTMIPMTAHPHALTRYIWQKDGLGSQTDHYGTWRPNHLYHTKTADCTLMARDSLKFMRCAPHLAYRSIEPTVLLLFVNDQLVQVFHDNRGSGIDGWDYFGRAERGVIATARHQGAEAILLCSGEVLLRTPDRWDLLFREPAIYRGECDCE